MKNLKFQRGFVTLELIFVTIIIAILAMLVMPKLRSTADIVILDYEMKRLNSELDFMQSISKVSSYDASIFQQLPTLKDKSAMANSTPTMNLTAYSYEIVQNGKKIRNTHTLANGIKITSTIGYKIKLYEFGRQIGQSGHILMTSKMGRERYLYFDSVGRRSIDHKKR